MAFRRHRGETVSGERSGYESPRIPPAVRILRGDAELREALARARALEERVTQRTLGPSGRYALLIEDLGVDTDDPSVTPVPRTSPDG